MNNWPGSTSASAAEIAATHQKTLVQIGVMLVVVVALGVLNGAYFQSETGGTIVFVALLFLGLAAVANFQIARTAKRVAADLAANPGATAWRMQLGLLDGRRLKSSLTSFLVSAGEDYRVYLNGKVVERGSVTLVEDGEVRRTDYRVSEGPRSGQIYQQISTVRDDLLLACAGAPGGPRPEGFSCTPGSGRTLSVWTSVS